MLNPVQTQIHYNYRHAVRPRQTKIDAVPQTQLAPCLKPYYLSFGEIKADSTPNKAFTEFLSTYVFENPEDINEFMKNDKSDFQGIVGSIPKKDGDWNWGGVDKKKLFATLNKFALKIREIYQEHNYMQNMLKMDESILDDDEYDEQETNIRQKKQREEKAALTNLINAFKDLGIIKQDKTVNIEPKINGTRGIVYCLDNKYALKILKNADIVPAETRHGTAVESNIALFLKNKIL